ncbi:MAG: hypothetical protein EA364_16050 [Balneolaceae bacterium]|nr:MAG: hypothetical protein EA364_16050 [Balneolaceae bacterium]
MHTTGRNRLISLLPVLFLIQLLLLPALVPDTARAQGVAQVQLTGVPPVLNNPTIAEQVRRYDEGSVNMQFIYTSPGAMPEDFRFRFVVDYNGRPVLDVLSEPVRYQPGVYRYRSFDDFVPIRFQRTLASVLSELNSSFDGSVNRAGVLPEGTYTLSVEAVPENEASLITVIPAFSTFSVHYAEPPVLIAPTDQSLISPTLPIFSWSTVGGLPPGSMVEYEFRLVEIFSGQSVGIAIEANRPLVNQIVSGNSFIYGADQLPLQVGRRYAWRIRATEAMFGIPFTDDGYTEIYSFTITDQSGAIVDNYTWRFPFSRPFLEVTVEDALIGSNSIRLDGRTTGVIDGRTTGITIDELVLDPDGSTVRGGRAIPDITIPFESAIGSGGSLQPFATAGETPSAGNRSQVWFRPNQLRIMPQGIVPSQTGRGAIRFNDMDITDLDVAFSSDFALGDDMTIVSGRANFSREGVPLAVIDMSGFRFDQVDETDMLAALPERIAILDEEIAFIRLRDDTMAFVDLERRSDGFVRILPRSSLNPVLVLKSLAGGPELAVTLQEMVLDPSMRQIVSGGFTFAAANEAAAMLLADRGFPLRLKSIHFNPAEGFRFDATLRLFDRTFDEGGDLSLYVNRSGIMQSSVSLANASLSVPLAGNGDKVSLDIHTVNGLLDMNLLTPDVPWFSLNLGALFTIKGSQASSTTADVMFSFNAHGDFIFNGFAGAGENELAVIDIDPVRFDVERINSLTLGYSRASGFDFNAKLDVNLSIRTGAQEIAIPLNNIELRNSGFLIPDQNLHDGQPGFNIPAFTMGPVELRLLAMRLPGIQFDWFNWTAGTPGTIDPKLDFEIGFPGFRDRAGELAHAPVTLQNAGLDGGFITGELIPYTFQGSGVFVPFGGTTGIHVQRIEGRLFRDGSRQGIDVRMNAGLHAPALFPENADGCSAPNFTVALAESSRFEGRIENINLCRIFQAGPGKLTFGNGFVDFSVSGDSQQLKVGGSVTAELTADYLTGAAATGSIELDVISGQVLSLSAVATDLTWRYPAARPMFTFGVSRAEFTPQGLVMNGGGTLNLQSRQMDVQLSDLSLDFSNGSISGGEVEIRAGFGLEVGVSPFGFTVVDKTALTGQDENKALLVLQPGLKINRDGLTIDGSATAHVRALGIVEEGISANFDGFRLGFSPVGVRDGRVDMMRGDSRIGFIDKTGFTLDNILAILPLPDKLPLPNQEIAYLVLKDGDEELVELGTLNEGETTRSMKTKDGKTVKLVIASLGEPGSHPEFDIAFDLTVNATNYTIMGGEIDVQLTNNPYKLSNYGLPLDLTRIRYAMQSSGSFELTAGTRLVLPEGVPGLTVNIGSELTFTENGFKSLIIADGEYSLTRPVNAGQITPMVSVMMPDSTLGMAVTGLNVNIGESSSFKLSGDVTSKVIRDADGNMSPLHFSAAYDEAQNSWLFSLDTSHLPGGKLPLYKADFAQDPNTPFTLAITETDFAVSFAGVITIPDLGDDFAIAIERFLISRSEIEIAAALQMDQQINMFGDFLTLTVSRIGLEYSSNVNVFYVEMDGAFDTKVDQAKRANDPSAPTTANLASFSGMRVGTDGSFELGSGQVNLLAGRTLDVLDDVMWLSELGIGFRDDALLLSLGGVVQLPVPGQTGSGSGTGTGQGTTQGPGQGSGQTGQQDPVRSDIRIAINSRGEIVDDLQLTFSFDSNSVPVVGNNTATEFRMGDIATFELTGAAVDFDVMNPVNTTLYGAAAVHIHNKGQTPAGSNRDAGGRDRVIMLGNANDIRTSPGIKYSFVDGLEFIIDVQGTEENPLFSFEAGLFRFDLVSLYMPDVTDFNVTIAGVAGVELSGVSGSFGFEGFSFGSQGITDWGGPSGSFSLSVMDVVSIELNQFAFQRQRAGGPAVDMPMVKRVVNAGTESDSTYTIAVKQYLMFAGAQISLGKGDAFRGGVDKVLFYETMAGAIHLNIENANIQIGEVASLMASLEFATDNTGFLLRVAGVGRLRDLGFAAVGKIATINNELSFGIFIAGTGLNLDLFPIVPGTIIMKGGGAGFFYRPEQRDIELVYTALNNLGSGGFRVNNPNGLPSANGTIFAVMIYAELGLVGSVASGFMVDGRALLTVTDQFANIDVNGFIARQTGSPGTLYGGLYLTVKWPTPANASFSIEGGVSVDVTYPVVTGSARVDFFLAKPENQPLVWAIMGRADFRVISFVNLSGRFLVSPNGMLLSLSSRVRFDVSIVSVSSNMELAFWFVRQGGGVKLGIYAEFSAKASVLSGAATMSATLKGALIIERGNFLFYASGSAHVKVIAVFEGRITAWVSVENGRPKAGTGKNSRYENMVAAARGQASNLESEARALTTQLNAARGAQFAFTQEYLRNAGINLRSLSLTERRQVAGRMLTLEERFSDFLNLARGSFDAYLTDIVIAENQPVPDEARIALDRMQEKITILNEKAAQANLIAEDLELRFEGLQRTFADIDDHSSPLLAVETYDFVLDTERDSVQTGQLQTAYDEYEDMFNEYRSAITRSETAITMLAAELHGPEGLTTYMPAFTEAYVAMNEYYAKVLAYHSESISHGNGMWQTFTSHNRAIYNTFNSSTPINNIFQRFISSVGALNFSAFKTFQAEFSSFISQNVDRYRLIQDLALAEDSLRTRTSELNKSASEYDSYLRGLDRTQLEREIADKGVNLWVDVLRYSIAPYIMWHTRQQHEMAREYNRNIWEEIRTNYSPPTRSISRLFVIQSRMIENQIAMIDEFIDWAGDGLSTADRSELRNQRQLWAVMLEPPRIDSFTMTPNRTGHFNRVELTWAASHPSGDIAESVIRIFGSGVGDIYQSMGPARSLTQFVNREHMFRDTGTLRIQLLVRGPGGTLTFTDTDWVTVAVAPEGDSRPGVVAGPATTILPPAASEVPAAPGIVFPFGNAPDGSVWTSDPARLEFILTAADESGTQLTYEASIGTAANPQSVLDWVILPAGARPPEMVDYTKSYFWRQIVGYQVEFGVGDQTRYGIIEGLNLNAGQSYRLAARATNAYNNTGAESVINLRYDATPPVFASGTGRLEVEQPRLRDTRVMSGTGGMHDRPVVIQPFNNLMPEIGQYDNVERMMQWFNRPDSVTITAQWPAAADPESGVKQYDVVVSGFESAVGAFRGAGRIYTTTDTRASMKAAYYLEPFYIHVRAVNYAGGAEIFTMGPFEPMPDPTRPVFPQTLVGYVGDDLVLWLRAPGQDNESGIAGYQFAIGYETGNFGISPPGNVQIRDWPQGGQLDFRAGQYDIPIEGELAPGFILNVNPADMETADDIYIYTRSVNTQGIVSDAWPTGGRGLHIRDVTPPLIGNIRFEYYPISTAQVPPRPERLDVIVDEVYDPGSGLSSFTMKLSDLDTGEELWTESQAFNPESAGFFTRRQEYSGLYGGPIRFDDDRRLLGRRLKFDVTVINGAGLVAEASAEHDMTVQEMPDFTILGLIRRSGYVEPMLDVSIRGVNGHEAGIRSVEVMLEDADTGEMLADWESVTGVITGGIWLGGPMDLSYFRSAASFHNRRLRVTVRAVDGLDRVKTITRVLGS